MDIQRFLGITRNNRNKMVFKDKYVPDTSHILMDVDGNNSIDDNKRNKNQSSNASLHGTIVEKEDVLWMNTKDNS